MIKGILLRIPRLDRHHILHAVVDELGRGKAEVIGIQILLVQQHLLILHDVELHGQHRTTHHLHAQRVALLLTQ